MSILNALFKEDNSSKLISPSNFETTYIVTTKNEFKMGIENPVIKLETESEVFFKQLVEDNIVTNTIETKNIKGHTDSDKMKPNLDQMLLLADISKRIVIKRDSKGKMKSVANMNTLKKDWQLWKETKLQIAFPDIKQQTAFIKNYENGLDKMDDGIKKSFQYLVLMPEIYDFKNYISNQNPDTTSNMEMVSKLVANMVIKYNLALVKMKAGNETILNLKSDVLNKGDMKDLYLAPLYNNHKEFSISNYMFKITIDYTLDKVTSKIINANFLLLEQMHDNLQYKLEINVKEVKK
jgi:hypothetical protein